MPRSIKARKDCLDTIRLAIKSNGFHTQRALAEMAEFSLSTVKKFLSGKSVDFATFSELCQTLSLDWQDIADLEGRSPVSNNLPQVESLSRRFRTQSRRQDWGEAMDVSAFQGRITELSTLKKWIVTEHCRLLAILGMGGIGKTALSVKLAHLIQDEFDYVIWRSLRNAVPVQDILIQLIHFFSDQQAVEIAESFSGQILQLIAYLRKYRCLIILDNVESILQSCDRTGCYKSGYEGYEQLFRCVGETIHQSCLLLTSREKPRGFAVLEGEATPVRCFKTSGLSVKEGQQLLQSKGCFIGSTSQWQSLITRYGGNPLALKIVASSIYHCFNHNIADFLDFLEQEPFIFDDIHDLLEQQFKRLTLLEQSIMYWLAVNREGTSLDALQDDFITKIPASDLLQAIAALQQRSLIESHACQFTQQPVVMAYVIHRFIEQACYEIRELAAFDHREVSDIKSAYSDPLPLMMHSLSRHHALLKAQARDYIQETQKQFILQPIIDRLMVSWGDCNVIENHLTQILDHLRPKSSLETGYLGGNIINLLRQLKGDLSHADFSNLAIWQANFQGTNLRHTRFNDADVSKSVFSNVLGVPFSVSRSPDGKLLATGDAGGDIRIWKILDGQQIMTFKGHTNSIWSIAFSPDGALLASGSADHTIKLWEVGCGQCLDTFVAHTNWVWAVTFSPDGAMLASGSADHTIKIWDVSQRQCLKTLEGHQSEVCTVTFLPRLGDISGNRHFTLASGSADHTIKLWNLYNGDCLQTLQEHTDKVWSLVSTPDGQTLISGSADHTIKLWNIHNGGCTKTLKGHTSWIRSIHVSADGQTLASGSADHTIKLWNIHNGDCIRTLRGHVNWVWSVTFGLSEFTPSVLQKLGNSDLAASEDDVASAGGVTSILTPPILTTPILISGSEDGTVKFWNSNDGQCLNTLQGNTCRIWSLAFAPQPWSQNNIDPIDGYDDVRCPKTLQTTASLLASGDEAGNVTLWDSQNSQCLNTLKGHTGRIWSLAFAPRPIVLRQDPSDHEEQADDAICSDLISENPILASGSADHSIKLWDTHKGQCISTLSGHTNWVWSVAFSPDSTILASSSADRTVKLWDVVGGKCLKTLEGHQNWVLSIAFSPDGQTLASSSADKTIKLWNIHSGQCIKTLEGHDNWIWSIAFNPDGKTLASGGADQTIKLWDISKGQCFDTLEGHTNWILSIAFCADGYTLASGTEDHVIKLWHIHDKGRCFKTLQEHTARVWAVTFSPDGQTLTSGSEDGTIKLWDAQTGDFLETLEPERPYQGMNISGVQGLNEAQKATLKTLGAIEEDHENHLELNNIQPDTTYRMPLLRRTIGGD